MTLASIVVTTLDKEKPYILSTYSTIQEAKIAYKISYDDKNYTSACIYEYNDSEEEFCKYMNLVHIESVFKDKLNLKCVDINFVHQG